MWIAARSAAPTVFVFCPRPKGLSVSAASYRDLVLLRRFHEQGDPRAREQLIERGRPLVRSIVRRYDRSGEPVDDLMQVGYLGLVKAIDGFDARVGTAFVSYAAPSISGELKRHFRDHTWAMHVPRGMQELNARVRTAQSELEAADGRTPTADEVATHLGESRERVLEALAVTAAHRTQPIDATPTDGRALEATLGKPDDELEQVEIRALIRQCASGLDDRQRKVLWMRFFRDMLQREIAAEIGVSQMQVSRLLSSAFDRMREIIQGPGGSGRRLA